MQDTMNLNEAKRSALITQLSKLREMTTENGCTEAEANNAAAMAQRLMDQYGVTMSDIEATIVQEELCEQDEFTVKGRKSVHEVQYVAQALANYTHCTIYRDDRIRKLVFFGMSADVQIAKYLMGVFQVAMDTEFAKYWKVERQTSRHHGRSARKGFMLGMASRLRQRLYELIEARKAALDPVADSRQLVIVKDQIVNAALAKKGIHFSVRMQRYSTRDSGSYRAGHEAGDRVGISAGGLNGTLRSALK
jgi:hypothetical protein